MRFIDSGLIKVIEGMIDDWSHKLMGTRFLMLHTCIFRVYKYPLGFWCLFLCIKGLFRDITMLIWHGFLLRTLAWMSLLSTICLLSALHLLKAQLWELSPNHPFLGGSASLLNALQYSGWGYGEVLSPWNEHIVSTFILGVEFLMSCDNTKDFTKSH